jgi:two-component system, sensor histidine kinase RegB
MSGTAVMASRADAILPSGVVQPGRAPHVVLPFLVRLRWVSVVALAAAAWAAERYWRVDLPWRPLLVLLLALAATNAALALQLRSPERRRGVIAGVLLLDVGLLTAILFLAGGPLNPFSIVYLVGITVAAVSLGHRWAIAIAIVSNLAYGWTFLHHRPLQFSDAAYGSRVLALHLYGMWVALAAAAGLIAHFVSRVSEALERRERELAQVRSAAERSERLAALLALGAGAAHELATPLSTIGTAAGELDRAMALVGGPEPAAVSEYVGIIRQEVQRCTLVLDQLSGRAASASAADREIVVAQLVGDLRQRLGESLSRRLDISVPEAPRPLAIPGEALRQVVVALVRNAFDASGPDQRVTLAIEQGDGVRVQVRDRGRGMSAEEAQRAGDPFFTTKAPGGGLGLGLFLARAFADQMGGSLQWNSRPGEGTLVVLDLPDRARS